MTPEEFAASTKAALKKAEKPAIMSLEGILSLGTTAAGIFAAVGLSNPIAQIAGLVVAGGASIYLAKTRGKLKEMLIALAGDWLEKKVTINS